jgi:putative membrane protein
MNKRTKKRITTILCYVGIIILTSLVFNDTIYIDPTNYGVWFFVTGLLIYILNRTIKPILHLLTLPLTALTLGLFYPVLSIMILNLADFLLGSHFIIEGLFMTFIVSIFMGILNAFAEARIIDPISKGVRK